MIDADLDVFAELVGDVDRFAEEHWGRRPMHRRAGADLKGVLDVAAVEALLLTGARHPTFRLVRDGITLPPERSTRPLRLGGRPVDGAADLGRIAEAVDEGATLVLQGLQRTSLDIALLCRSLERATSHPVQANAYLTPVGGSGLTEHADDHDVLVLQLLGTKDWVVEGLGPLRLETGDVLYLPARTAHRAEAQEGPSLHLTIGLLAITYARAIERALDRVGPEELRRPLPIGFARPDGVDRLHEELGAVLNATAAALAGADAAAVGDHEIERSRTRRAPLLTGQLQSVLDLGALDLDTLVRRRPDQPGRVRATDDAERVLLELADRRLSLPVVARPALEAILATDAIRVGSLPGVDDDSKLVLARRLVREGLLVIG